MFFFFFKQKTAYEMRISDWSSDVCSSDLHFLQRIGRSQNGYAAQFHANVGAAVVQNADGPELGVGARFQQPQDRFDPVPGADQKRRPTMCAVSRPDGTALVAPLLFARSEERRVGKEDVRKGISRCATHP